MPASDEFTRVLVEADEAEAQLGSDDLIVIDLCKSEVYRQLHIPGAVHLEYSHLIAGTRPAPGLLPGSERLNSLAMALGIHPTSRVICYDDEGGGRAGRFLWTLHVMGFTNVSVINGGLHAWANEGHPTEQTPNRPLGTGTLQMSREDSPCHATRDYVLNSLEDDSIQLLDCRTAQEYTGARAFSLRGGHIPGARNINWVDTMDQSRNLRLKSEETLNAMLQEQNLYKDQEIITYCQTHHRSSHSYMMLKHLGYKRVRGYAGAWAEWGNDPDLPVSTSN